MEHGTYGGIKTHPNTHFSTSVHERLQIIHPIYRRLIPRQLKRLIKIFIILIRTRSTQIPPHGPCRFPTRMSIVENSALIHLLSFECVATAHSILVRDVRPRAARGARLDVVEETYVRVEHHFGFAVVERSGGPILQEGLFRYDPRNITDYRSRVVLFRLRVSWNLRRQNTF